MSLSWGRLLVDRILIILVALVAGALGAYFLIPIFMGDQLLPSYSITNGVPQAKFSRNLAEIKHSHWMVARKDPGFFANDAVFVEAWESSTTYGVDTGPSWNWQFKGVGEPFDANKGIIEGIAPPLIIIGTSKEKIIRSEVVNKALFVDEDKFRLEEVPKLKEQISKCAANAGYYSQLTLDVAKLSLEQQVTDLFVQANKDYPSIKVKLTFENESELIEKILEYENAAVAKDECNVWLELD